MTRIATVCVGGGSGRRFGSDKLQLRLGESSVFECALEALRVAFPEAVRVAVVAPSRRAAWRDQLAGSVTGAGLLWVDGGRRRQDSVRHGVEAAAAAGVEVVVIHDGARPLLHPDDARAALAALEGADGVVLCAPVVDTIKEVAPDGRILRTVDRETLRAALTPQVFRVATLTRLWDSPRFAELWTDEAALVEAVGGQLRWVDARHPNPKLTHRSDVEPLRALLRSCS